MIVTRKSRPELKEKIKDLDINHIEIDSMLLKENKIDIFQEPKIVDSNDLLFTLFTSGSTGKPKGINHSVAGYLVYSKYSIDNFFNLDSESNILKATDAGWINGHTYALYGPLLANSKITLIEDLTKLSNPDFLYRVISTLKVTHFYASVTLLRLIKFNAKKSLNVSNLDELAHAENHSHTMLVSGL